MLPGKRSECPPIASTDFLSTRLVALTATMGNLDGTHHCCQSAGSQPIEAVGDAIEEAGTISVTTAGGIDNVIGLDAGDLVALAIGMNF